VGAATDAAVAAAAVACAVVGDGALAGGAGAMGAARYAAVAVAAASRRALDSNSSWLLSKSVSSAGGEKGDCVSSGSVAAVGWTP